MIDAKITLELLQNGIQKFIFAKTSEQQARRILCTLTENGKVFNVSGYSFKVYHKEGDTVYYYDDPEQVYQIPGTSTIAFILPANQTGEKVYELCITQNNTIIYAPQFKVFYEGTIGPGVTPDPGTVTAYEPKITLSDVETTFDTDDYIVMSASDSPNDTYRLSVSDFLDGIDGDDIAYDSETTVNEKIDALSDDIDAIEDDLDDIDAALLLKVDKEAGKGLSTNDYSTAEKTKLSGIESGAEANVQSDWNQADDSAEDFIKNKPTIPAPYSLPTASASTLGGVKIDDDTIKIDNDGVISATATGKATEIEDSNNPGYAIDTPANIYTRLVGGEVFMYKGSVLVLKAHYNTYINFISTSPDTSGISTEFVNVSIGHNKAIQISEAGDPLTAAQSAKLSGIAEGAEVNVQSDWNQSDTGADDYIKNKPSIPSPYSLPTASSSTLGGVKIDDDTIKIDGSGVISAEEVIVLTNTSGVCNYSKSEIDAFVSAGKVLMYNGKVLIYNGTQTNSVFFWSYNSGAVSAVQIGNSESDTAFTMALSQTLANNNQTVDGTTDTIANHLSSLKSQKVNKPTTATITLDKDDWVSNEQTINVTGMTATKLVQVAPSPASYEDYGNAEIRCTTQGTGTLTFECTDVPTVDVDVNIMIWEV